MMSHVLGACICFVLFNNVASLGGPKNHYSNQWILKSSLTRTDIGTFAQENGFELIFESRAGLSVLRETGAGPMTSSSHLNMVKRIQTDHKIDYLYQMKYLNRTTRTVAKNFIVNDSNWADMWHVSEQFPGHGIYSAWSQGYSGAGIHVSILDDGVEPDHPDLVNNYDAENSYDYLYNSTFVNHTETDFHGTWCAGIISATKNDFCVLGTAYGSMFSSVKIFDNYYGLTDYGESLALSHNHVATDVSSNSWGPSDYGDIFDGPGPLAQEALEKSITEGRDGKGLIYTWAAGNGGLNDDCNCDGYAGSKYTISITSIGRDQGASWYSEECTSIMAGTYSGDSPDLRIATTDTGGLCTTRFQGTSASCPLGAGIIALVLEANPDLTWRDVQHLIASTATRDGLIGANWQTNGAGMAVSHVFGFGIMNAEAMIEAALSWTNVSPQQMCESEVMIINRDSSNGVYVMGSVETNGCDRVGYLEHVEVEMDFHSTYRGSLQITLTSPSGTKSRLLRQRPWDTFNGSTTWTFMTLLSWGEIPNGAWTLQMETLNSDTIFGMTSWKLITYGTTAAPSYNPGPAAQTSPEALEDDGSTCYIVAGVIGGVALFAVVALATYLLVIKKAKDPVVYPTGEGDEIRNTRFTGGGGNEEQLPQSS